MYQTIAILAGILLLYCAVAGRIDRSSLSSAIVFTGAGILLAPPMLNALSLPATSAALRGLAEMTLAMVLFSDAASADTGVIRRHLGLPLRLLLVGLPLTIVLGLGFAWLLFPSLGWLELALLAVILAPTDAALGAPVVTNQAVPAPMRESLNLESGLNDGICVPLVVILLGYAVGTQIEHGTVAHISLVVIEEFGIGLAVGAGLALAARTVLRAARRAGWLSEAWRDLPALALAACCFAAAQALGGSGFIACFVAGLVLSSLPAQTKHEMLPGSENAGRILAAATWILFGSAVVPILLARLDLASLVYAVLSLTVIRMVPVALCLAGSGMTMGGRLFMGWFGPRGLASIVFAIIVLDERLPGNETIIVTTGCTILLSVIAHGATANPLVRRIAAWETSR